MRHSLLVLVSFVAALALPGSAAAQRRALTAEDINALHQLSDPQVSPDGEWVAYEVRTTDLAKDKRVTHIWMASWDGKRTVQL
ncbi:MAG: S9 family peptidase, partial [Steroidobacteraceae bacterium]